MTLYQEIIQGSQSLRKEIKTLLDMEQQRDKDGVLYEGSEGKVKRLLKKERIALCDAPYPLNSSLGLHQHNAIEVIIVYEGELELEIGGETVVVGERDLVKILENVPHRVKNANKASRCVGVTMPADIGYP